MSLHTFFHEVQENSNEQIVIEFLDEGEDNEVDEIENRLDSIEYWSTVWLKERFLNNFDDIVDISLL